MYFNQFDSGEMEGRPISQTSEGRPATGSYIKHIITMKNKVAITLVFESC